LQGNNDPQVIALIIGICFLLVKQQLEAIAVTTAARVVRAISTD